MKKTKPYNQDDLKPLWGDNKMAGSGWKPPKPITKNPVDKKFKPMKVQVHDYGKEWKGKPKMERNAIIGALVGILVIVFTSHIMIGVLIGFLTGLGLHNHKKIQELIKTR
jgi:hypothetical protein